MRVERHRDLGLGPEPREKPDPGPLGKKRTLGPNETPDPWTLWKNRTLDKKSTESAVC